VGSSARGWLGYAGLPPILGALITLVLPAFGVAISGVIAIVCAVALIAGIAFWIYGARFRELRDPRAMRRFTKNTGAIVGAVLTAIIVSVALFGPWIAPNDPDRIFDSGLEADGTPVSPNGQFRLGADNMGRDEVSRLLFGGRISLAVAIGATALAGLIGFGSGLLAGYFGGLVDTIVMRITDFVLSLPFLLVAIAVNRVIHDPSLASLCGLLGALSWATLARVTRTKTMQVRELEYVQAARALGLGHARILLRHIVPNVTGPAIVIVTTLVAQMIVVESAMSYLGLGVQPPTASWGSMVNEGQDLLMHAPRLVLLPGLFIIITVFGFNLLGEGLRDALDPKE
jgi:peptide/nickel transport system permease protein